MVVLNTVVTNGSIKLRVNKLVTLGKIILRYLEWVSKLLVKSIRGNVTLGKIALSKIILDRFWLDTVVLILNFITKNLKSQQNLIYDKTAYFQSKIFIQVLTNFTQPLLAMVVTFPCLPPKELEERLGRRSYLVAIVSALW